MERAIEITKRVRYGFLKSEMARAEDTQCAPKVICLRTTHSSLLLHVYSSNASTSA
jgi:hypothetical protein